MEFKKPSDTIFYQIEKAIKQYRLMAQGNLNKLGYKITLNQILLMIQVRDNSDVSQVELSELLFKDVASIARMTDILVKEDLLERKENKHDRRKKDLKITPKGNKLLNLATPVIAKNREIAQQGMTMNEKRALFNLLSKIISNTSR